LGNRRRWLALFLLLVAPVSPALGQTPKVERGEVSDTRATAHGMGALTVELKLTGENLEGITSARPRLKMAKDDKGNVLLPKNGPEPEFEEWAPNRSPQLRVRLLNPARGASSVDLAGEVDVFVPARDPASTVRLEKLLARLDKPVSSSALKSAGVEVTPLSPAQFVERRKKAKPTKEQMAAEGRKRGMSEEEIKQGLELMEAFSSLGEEPPGETSVLFELKDPENRVLSAELVDADGKELDRQGRSSSGREISHVELKMREKPPEGAALKVTLRTNKGTLVVPFSLKQEVLP